MISKPYTLALSPMAERQLSALSARVQKNTLKWIELLAMNPRLPQATRIDGLVGLYCLIQDRVEIVYRVEDQEVLILVVH